MKRQAKITPEDETIDKSGSVPSLHINRSCRDVFWLLLFVLFWGGMVLVAFIGIQNGDPKRLLLGEDSFHQRCGVNNTINNSSLLDLSSKPLLYYFNPLSASAYQICVDTCPTTAYVPTYSDNNTLCIYPIKPTSNSDNYNKQQSGLCAAYVYKTKPVLGRCVPDGNFTAFLNSTTSSNNGTMNDPKQALFSGRDALQTLSGDILESWLYLASAIGAAVVLCYIWLILLRFMTGPITWATLIAAVGVSGASAGYMFLRWQHKTITYNNAVNMGIATGAMKTDCDITLGIAITAAVVALVLFLMIVGLRSRIRIAIQILKETSRAVGAVPMIVFYPIITFVSMACLIVYYLVIAAYIASIPDVSSVNVAGTSQPAVGFKYFQWYHLFGFLWTFAFFSGINQTVIAGSICTWYWTFDKRSMPRFAVLSALYRTIRYSLGSIALGSVIIAITQMIRIIIIYAQRNLNKADNKAVKFLLSCLSCCVACLERFLKFINKNAYIHIAMYGTSFCTAARSAVELLTRNALRLVAVDFVASFIVLLSKLCTTVGTAIGLYVVLQYAEDRSLIKVENPAALCLIVAAAAWMVVTCFYGVYRMGISTIFLCFCEDVERNDGSPQKPYYMGPGLQALTSMNNPIAKEEKM